MGGGCIGEVYEAELSEGSKAVAKVDRAGESHLEREAYMLRYLGDKSDLPVPKVYYHSEKLLLMEFVEGGGNLSVAEEHAAELRARLEKLAGKLDELLVEPEHPSLIHGDVWGGNVLARGDRIAAFLDPAIYHADPDVELAFIALFDTFGERFFRRYGELREVRPGFFEARRHLYNLYPLLVHVYFFGGGYVRRVDDTLRSFGF